MTYITAKNPKLIKNSLNYIENTLNNTKTKTKTNTNTKTKIKNKTSKTIKTIKNIKNNKEDYILFNKNKIIKKPVYLELINSDINYLPQNIINDFNITNNKNGKNILTTFLNIKYIFSKLFINNDEIIINNLYDFLRTYKNIIKNINNNEKINICMLFYNNTDKQYYYTKNKTLIKMSKSDSIEYELIYNILKKNNIFLIKNNDELILSYGNYIDSKISDKDIIKLFNDKILYNDEYTNLLNYTNISVFYWVSKKINII